MSDENKFFRFVWRFNAIAIALAVLGILLLSGGALVYSLFTALPFEKPQGHFAPVPTAAEAKNTYRLLSAGSLAFLRPGGGQEVHLVFTLAEEDDPSNPYGLGSSGRGYRESDKVNIMLEYTETGEGHWLFAGHERNILDWDALIDPLVTETPGAVSYGPKVVPAATTYGDATAVRAIILKVVDKDTDADGKLTGKDRLALYTWHLGDKAPAKLLDADLILSQAQIGADRYVVSYETGRAAFIAIYSVPDFKLLTRKPLPKLPG